MSHAAALYAHSPYLIPFTLVDHRAPGNVSGGARFSLCNSYVDAHTPHFVLPRARSCLVALYFAFHMWNTRFVCI